jgi:Methyltransferase domain
VDPTPELGLRTPQLRGWHTTDGARTVTSVGIEAFTGARDRLLRIIEDEAGIARILDETLASFHAVTRFSWCALMTVDPKTLLPTGGIVEGFAAEACAPFWDNELLAPGFNKFNALARSTDTVATLYDVTDGDIERAPIYTDVYAPLGVADELRAAFVLGTTCWGVTDLVRATEDGPFPSHEVSQVRSLAPLIARAFRSVAPRCSQAGERLVEQLAPRPGDVVIDVGCGPGLNFTALQTHIGPTGRIIGIDESPQLLAVAAHQATRRGWDNIELINAPGSHIAPAGNCRRGAVLRRT